MSCFILVSAIYYGIYLIYFFLIRPNLYIDEDRDVKVSFPRWKYFLSAIIGLIPLINLTFLIFIIIVFFVNLSFGWCLGSKNESVNKIFDYLNEEI